MTPWAAVAFVFVGQPPGDQTIPCPPTAGGVAKDFFYHATPMTWTQAEDFCKAAHPGGHLASIASEVQNTCLTNGLTASTDAQFWYVWHVDSYARKLSCVPYLGSD